MTNSKAVTVEWVVAQEAMEKLIFNMGMYKFIMATILNKGKISYCDSAWLT